MKKILIVFLILAILSLGVVSAYEVENAIDMGSITRTSIEVNDYDESTGDFDFDAEIDVDISKMSKDDRTLLEDAIKDNNTSFILNLTYGKGSGVKIALWTYDGLDDVHIDGDTLYIKNNNNEFTIDDGFAPEEVEINAVSFNTTDGQILTSKLY